MAFRIHYGITVFHVSKILYIDNTMEKRIKFLLFVKVGGFTVFLHVIRIVYHETFTAFHVINVFNDFKHLSPLRKGGLKRLADREGGLKRLADRKDGLKRLADREDLEIHVYCHADFVFAFAWCILCRNALCGIL